MCIRDRYYIIFRFMISKFNYKTPGRDDAEEVKLYTRADVNARNAASGSVPAGNDPVSALIVEGLGGAANLSDVDCLSLIHISPRSSTPGWPPACTRPTCTWTRTSS